MKAKLRHHINLLRQSTDAYSEPVRSADGRPPGYLITALELGGVAAMLVAALAVQFVHHESPRPLCLLERAGLLLAAVGLLLNLRLGLRPAHHVLVLLGAVFSAGVALRQLAVQQLPRAAGGAPAPHLAAWWLAAATVLIAVTVAMLGFRSRLAAPVPDGPPMKTAALVLFALLAAVAAVNLASVSLECGLSQCPGSRAHYRAPSS